MTSTEPTTDECCVRTDVTKTIIKAINLRSGGVVDRICCHVDSAAVHSSVRSVFGRGRRIKKPHRGTSASWTVSGFTCLLPSTNPGTSLRDAGGC